MQDAEDERKVLLPVRAFLLRRRKGRQNGPSVACLHGVEGRRLQVRRDGETGGDAFAYGVLAAQLQGGRVGRLRLSLGLGFAHWDLELGLASLDVVWGSELSTSAREKGGVNMSCWGGRTDEEDTTFRMQMVGSGHPINRRSLSQVT